MYSSSAALVGLRVAIHIDVLDMIAAIVKVFTLLTHILLGSEQLLKTKVLSWIETALQEQIW